MRGDRYQAAHRHTSSCESHNSVSPQEYEDSYRRQALYFIQREVLGTSEKRSGVLLHPEGFLSENFRRNPERCILLGGTRYGFCGHASAMNRAGFRETFYRVARCSSCLVCKPGTPCPAVSGRIFRSTLSLSVSFSETRGLCD